MVVVEGSGLHLGPMGMIDVDLGRLFSAKGGRPLGVSVALGAIFLPSSLLLYLTRPDIYERYGLGGGIFFGAAAVGFPILYVCTWPWYTLLQAAIRQENIYRRIPDAAKLALPRPEPSTLEKVTADDPLEWPTLLTGGWTANGLLYVLVVIAYYRRLALGRTLILTAGIVLAVWLVLAILLHLGLKKRENDVQAAVARVQQAAGAMRSSAGG